MGSTSGYKIDVLSGLSQVDYKRHGLLITIILGGEATYMMTTFEMMKEAEKTGKIYIADDMRYSTENGFYDRFGNPWCADAFKTLNDVLNVSHWRLLEPKKMTLKEVEKKLGYEIELVSS